MRDWWEEKYLDFQAFVESKCGEQLDLAIDQKDTFLSKKNFPDQNVYMQSFSFELSINGRFPCAKH